MLVNLLLIFSQASGNELMYESMDRFGVDENIRPVNLAIPFIYTFPRKIKCIHIDTDNSVMAELLLIRIMKANVTLSFIQGNKKTFNCDSYLLLSKNISTMARILQKLPKWSTHRILSLINLGSVDQLDIFLKSNANMFGDAQALVVMMSNITIGYRIEQPIRKFDKYSIDKGFWQLDDGDIFNFKGREIKISTYNCSIFSQLGPIEEDGHPTYSDGYDYELFKEIAIRVNATYRVIPIGDTEKYKIENSHDEMLNKVIVGDVDMGFCGSLIESNKVPMNLELSAPVLLICFKFAVHRPSETNNNILAIFRPFTFDTWFTLFIAIVSTSIVLLVLVRIMNLMKFRKVEIEKYEHFGNSFLMLYGILVIGSWPKMGNKLGPIRHIIAWWVVFTLLLTNSYTSILVSVLATVNYSIKYNYINEFLDHRYFWPVTKSPYEGIFDMENLKIKKWFQRVKIVNSSDLNGILKENRKSVILTEQIAQINVPFGEDIDEEVLQHFETVDHCLASNFEGFLYRVGSPFNRAFNHYIRKLKESGITSKKFDKVLLRLFQNRSALYQLQEKRSSTKKGVPKKMKMENLNGIFDFLVLGMMISILVFVGEMAKVKLK